MIRRIKTKDLYKIHIYKKIFEINTEKPFIKWEHIFIEACTLTDLYQYIAQLILDGFTVESVMTSFSHSRRVPVFSSKEYKTIFSKLQAEEKSMPVPAYKGFCWNCIAYHKLFEWNGEPVKCPTCGQQLIVEKGDAHD